MADFKVRKVTTCVGRCAQVVWWGYKERIVKLSTWGRCLSNRDSCRREGGKEERAMASLPWDLMRWQRNMSWN